MRDSGCILFQPDVQETDGMYAQGLPGAGGQGAGDAGINLYPEEKETAGK